MPCPISLLRLRLETCARHLSLCVGPCTASYEPFYIERDPRSRTEIGERDTQLVYVNEATAV